MISTDVWVSKYQGSAQSQNLFIVRMYWLAPDSFWEPADRYGFSEFGDDWIRFIEESNAKETAALCS